MGEAFTVQLKVASERLDKGRGPFWALTFVDPEAGSNSKPKTVYLGLNAWMTGSGSKGDPKKGQTLTARLARKPNQTFRILEILPDRKTTPKKTTSTSKSTKSKPEACTARFDIVSEFAGATGGKLFNIEGKTDAGDPFKGTLRAALLSDPSIGKGTTGLRGQIQKSAKGRWYVKEIIAAAPAPTQELPETLTAQFRISGAPNDSKKFVFVEAMLEDEQMLKATLSTKLLEEVGLAAPWLEDMTQPGLDSFAKENMRSMPDLDEQADDEDAPQEDGMQVLLSGEFKRNSRGKYVVARLDGVPEKLDAADTLVLGRLSGWAKDPSAPVRPDYLLRISTESGAFDVRVTDRTIAEAGIDYLGPSVSLKLDWVREGPYWRIERLSPEEAVRLMGESAVKLGQDRYVNVFARTSAYVRDFTVIRGRRRNIAMVCETPDPDIRLLCDIDSRHLLSFGFTVLEPHRTVLACDLVLTDGRWKIASIVSETSQNYEPPETALWNVELSGLKKTPRKNGTAVCSFSDNETSNRTGLECRISEKRIENLSVEEKQSDAVFHCDLFYLLIQTPNYLFEAYFVSKVHRITV